MQLTTISELIKKYETQENKYIISFRPSTNNSNFLQKYIQKNPKNVKIVGIENFRDQQWGALTVQTGELDFLVLGYVTCCKPVDIVQIEEGEPIIGETVTCGHMHSHDIFAGKSGVYREEESLEFDKADFFNQTEEKILKLLKIKKAEKTSESDNDTPRSSSSLLSSETQQTTPTPKPKKIYTKNHWRGAGGALSRHEKQHEPKTLDRKPEPHPFAPNKVKFSSNHTKTNEIPQSTKNEIYDLQLLKIILAGGSLRSADSPADRLLVDKTQEVASTTMDTKPSELLGGRTVVSSRQQVLTDRLHGYHEKMMSGNSDYDHVYFNSSSDATQPKFTDFSMCDLTTRYTTIKGQDVQFFKSCVDLRELPKDPDNPNKSDHSSLAWGQQIADILKKLPVDEIWPKSKPDLPKNKELEEGFRKLSQYMISITVDNCNAAKRAALEMALFALLCQCHRYHTCIDTAIKNLTSEKTGYLYEELEKVRIMTGKITWTDIILNCFSKTREWRGMEVTIRQILNKWDDLKLQSSLLEFSMPDETFLRQFFKILEGFTKCYNRLESASALLSDSILTLHMLEEPLKIQEDDIPSIIELKKEILNQIKEKVLGTIKPTRKTKATNSKTSTSSSQTKTPKPSLPTITNSQKRKTTEKVTLQTHVITNLHKMSYLLLPTLDVMNFKSEYIGDKAATMIFVKEFYGSREFKNLQKMCGLARQAELAGTEELEMMGFASSEAVQPDKRQKKDTSTSPLFQISDQQKWSTKWLHYYKYVLENPLNLSFDSEVMKQEDYSAAVVQYLNNYRNVDAEFAELALHIILMLPSSSASEHLFSIANIQVRPNTKFPTLANRTLLASNAGFIMNGFC